MKKLLVTASTFPRYATDTEPRFIYDLCKEYAKHYEVTALVPAAPGAKDYELMEGIHVIRYHYFPIKKWETLCYPGAIVPRIKEKKIRGLLVPFLFISMYFALRKRTKDVDIVHANWLIPQGIIQRFFKKPYVLSGLGGDVTSLNKGVVKKLKQKALDRAAGITVVSEDLGEELKKVYGITTSQVLPMGCDLQKFSPKNREHTVFQVRSEKVILFVGRLAEKKGVHYLIQAMKELEAALVIVGDGPERQKLEEEASQVEAEILFVGSKTKDELAVLYASCDIFCVPSVVAKDGDKDGLPVALIEAMASGTPAVASQVGGIAEIIENNRNGFLVEPRDVKALQAKLNYLLTHDEKRKCFGIEARKKAEEFDFVKIGQQYHQIFQEILEKSE